MPASSCPSMNPIRLRSGLGTALPRLNLSHYHPSLLSINVSLSYQLFIVFAFLFLLSAFLLS